MNTVGFCSMTILTQPQAQSLTPHLGLVAMN